MFFLKMIQISYMLIRNISKDVDVVPLYKPSSTRADLCWPSHAARDLLGNLGTFSNYHINFFPGHNKARSIYRGVCVYIYKYLCKCIQGERERGRGRPMMIVPAKGVELNQS